MEQQHKMQTQQQQIEGQQLKFYSPADVKKSMFGNSFALRFQSLENSFITANPFNKLFELAKWKAYYENKGIPKDPQELEKQLPILEPKFDRPEDKITYTWIGHSTAVISIGTIANFIIDPVFADRASPVGFAGPERFRRPACSVQQLPKIDGVLVSHDHYDHLDYEALRKLEELHKPQFFAGLESRSVFPKGCKLTEMDWTQEETFEINKQVFKIVFVPVCHWSQRGVADQCKRLWGGFVLVTPSGKKIFYSGDTGYCEVFKEIGKVFGSIDLAILPIGAYQPRDILKAQHVNPQQAVMVHKEINSKKSVGVHWGTFPLGFEHWCVARDDLQLAKEKHNLKKEQFITIAHGEAFSVDL